MAKDAKPAVTETAPAADTVGLVTIPYKVKKATSGTVVLIAQREQGKPNKARDLYLEAWFAEQFGLTEGEFEVTIRKVA